jgi:HK97 family phage portal protein
VLSLLTRLASGMRTRPEPAQGVRAPVAGTSAVQYAAAGMPMTPDWDAASAVDQGYLGHFAVYTAVRTIAETVASLPFRAGRDPNKPGEFNPDAPLARLLGPAPGGPNPTTSSRALWAWSIAQRVVTGRMGWELERKPGSREIVNVWPLVSAYLKPVPSKDRSLNYFARYEYQLPSGVVPLRADQVFYSWRPSQRDWRQPETVLEAARMPINIAVALDRYNWGLLKNGMSGRKMIVTPPFAERDEQRAWEEQFLAEMTGFDNAGKPVFAQYEPDLNEATGKAVNASVQVIDLAQTSTDAQLMALMEYVEQAIYKALNVPESIIGDASHRTYSNAGEEYRVFWTRTMLPLLSEIADDINTYLAPQLGDEVGWFDVSGVEALRPAKVFQPEPGSKLVEDQIITPGELRVLGYDLPYEAPAGAEDEAPRPETVADDPGIPPQEGGRAAEPHPVVARIEKLVQDRQNRAAGVRVENSPKDVENTERLMRYWAEGAGAAKIGWGTDGDFDRCVVELGKYVGPKVVKGLCSNLHKRATGFRPGHAPGESKARYEWKGEAGPELIEFRDVLESGSAGMLLPKAPMPKSPVKPHVYRPSKDDRRKCATCGKGVTASVHEFTGRRHRGPHLPVPGGHANTPERRRQAVRKTIDRHVGTVEDQMATTLRRLFADQQKATVSRMQGNRGKQMIKAALRAADEQQPENEPPAPLIDPAHIFDPAHWTERTAQDVQGIMTGISSWVPGHFAQHTPGVGDVEDDSAAVRSVQDVLSQATNRIAGQTTDETFRQLQQALMDGVTAGDGYSALAARVRQVFDEASQVRAERIARTEVQSAVNSAQDTYASNLPAGVVGQREWLATPDERTRPDHAKAEGQKRAVGQPFQVGDSELMFPGDPSGPPGEVINCRCVLLYLPA